MPAESLTYQRSRGLGDLVTRPFELQRTEDGSDVTYTIEFQSRRTLTDTLTSPFELWIEEGSVVAYVVDADASMDLKEASGTFVAPRSGASVMIRLARSNAEDAPPRVGLDP